MTFACRAGIVAALAIGLAACSLPTNVALKNVDSLRAAEIACLRSNAARLDDRASDPVRIAQAAAQSCADETGKLAAYAVPRPSAEERRAFEQDAVMRATVYVAQARGGAVSR